MRCTIPQFSVRKEVVRLQASGWGQRINYQHIPTLLFRPPLAPPLHTPSAALPSLLLRPLLLPPLAHQVLMWVAILAISAY